MNTADVFAVAAALRNIAMVWPQAIKTVKLSNVDGISIPGWWVNLALFVVWLVYAAGNSLPILLIANISCTIAAVVILVNAQRYTPTLHPNLTPLLTGLLLTAAGAVFIAQFPLVVAVPLLISPIVSRAPHVISAIRTTNYTSFSTFTWSLTLTTGSLWMVSHMLAGVELAAIVNATSVLMTLVLLGIVAVRKKTFTYTKKV